jgi:membrane protein DedA with SNARE-associated domain
MRLVSVTSAGEATAAEFSEILSHPASSIARMSAGLRIPPPTVNGMNTSSATRVATSSMVGRFSWVAVMSRNTSSSAPSAS